MSLLVNLAVAFYIDKLGRRPILMISTLGMTIVSVLFKEAFHCSSFLNNNTDSCLHVGLLVLYHLDNS